MSAKGRTNELAAGKISHERASRLYRLVKILAESPVGRAQLVKRLKVGLRTFYRDVDLLRECAIEIETQRGGYRLGCSLDEALLRVPFPDPELTFGEIVILMKGRSGSHVKVRKLFQQLTQ